MSTSAARRAADAVLPDARLSSADEVQRVLSGLLKGGRKIDPPLARGERQAIVDLSTEVAHAAARSVARITGSNVPVPTIRVAGMGEEIDRISADFASQFAGAGGMPTIGEVTKFADSMQAGISLWLLYFNPNDGSPEIVVFPQAIREFTGRVGGNVLSAMQLIMRHELVHSWQYAHQPTAMARYFENSDVAAVVEGYATFIEDALGRAEVDGYQRLRNRVITAPRPHNQPTGIPFLEERIAMLPYRLGASFSRRVAANAGLKALSRMWDSPEMLPSHQELRAPEQWIRRTQPPMQPNAPTFQLAHILP